MDLDEPISDPELDKCCTCGCIYCSSSVGSYTQWNQSMKRKVDEFDDENGMLVPSLCYPIPVIARVNIENECDALRGIVNRQQDSIQHLCEELEEERSSSSTAANEAMSMILRLQRDKSVIQMEARQFKLYADEKMAHDQKEISALEDLLYKREQVMQSLTCEAQAYKHRMMSYGLTESEAEGEFDDDSISLSQEGKFQLPKFEYPPIKCISNEVYSASEVENEINDLEKYSFGGTPRSAQHLKSLDLRISQMERRTRFSEADMESPAAKSVIKNVIVGPSRMRHSRKYSVESSNSLLEYGKQFLSSFPEESPRFGSSFKKMNYMVHANDSDAMTMDNLSEVGDFMKDNTISPVYNVWPFATPEESVNHDEVKDLEIQKLYMRLQVLEAEKESMRQTLVSMGTDKAQVMLLKEIAQQLCKDMTPQRCMPAKKLSIFYIFPFLTVFKWVAAIVFWRKGPHKSKYMFELTSNIGLLMLLDRAPRVNKPWRCLTRPLV